jgi:hypothetical protein
MDNSSIGIGRGRNLFTQKVPSGLPPPLPQLIVHLSDVPEAERPKAVIKEKQTMKQNKGRRSVHEYTAILDDSTGKLMCTECPAQLSGLENLLAYLVAASLKTAHRQCVICNAQFSDHSRCKLAV